MSILAIAGSLRRASKNRAALLAFKLLSQSPTEVVIDDRMGDLPQFNPDFDEERFLPSIVRDVRSAVGQASCLLLACPEYAGGIPGAFKNLLDWLVASAEFSGKPVALLNTSPRAGHAQAALRHVLTTMSAQILEEASVSL